MQPALLICFLSGFAALVYQVIWQRLLVIFSGADVYSVTVIVAAFMGGLGLGSLAGGRLADRLGAAKSLLALAGAEALIGLFGLFSKTLYYDVLYVRFAHLAAIPMVAAAVLFATLLFPTFLMGLALPLLARALTDNLGATGRVVGSLYGWNTLGAAAGAFVSTWTLIPRFGLEVSLWIGASVNLICAALAAVLSTRAARNHRFPVTGATEDAPEGPPPLRESFPFGGWVLVAGLTGFIALGLEIVWFRLLGAILKSNAFTFGTLLGVYLAGLGLGAAAAARVVGRRRRPGRTFLLLQYAVTLYAACSTIAFVALVASGHPIKLVRHLAGNEPVDVYATVSLLRKFSFADGGAPQPFLDFLVLYLIVPAVLVGPPTFLMGLSFPYLQKAIHVDFPRLGRRLGILLAANIAGSVLGAMLAGWVLLPVLGTAGSLKALAGLGVLLAVPFARVTWPCSAHAAAVSALAAVLITGTAVSAIPDAQTLWARVHAAPPHHVLLGEDGAGLSVLKAEHTGFGGSVGVFVNGLSQSWIPYGGIHTALGALPALIHPAPADVAIIGLGSGDTAFAAAGRPEVRRLICIEIIGAQLATLRQLARTHPYAGLTALLTDPRVEHRVGDGRAYILHAGRLFDIIEGDALRPGSAHAGHLYSREYFGLLLRHLRPGGLAVTWAPTERIQRTFVSVFPHVLAFSDISLGSNAPILFDSAAVFARASTVRPHYAAAGVDIDGVLRPYLESVPRYFGPGKPRVLADLNTDIFPRDEFALPF